MKVAVIGTGKSGSRVQELLEPEEIGGLYNRANPPDTTLLAASDVSIIFVPGDAVDEIFETVLSSGKPAVWASTGYQWPDDLDQRVKNAGTQWVIASNFSLGMNLVRHCIRYLSRASDLLNDPVFRIHEVHHTAKKDAPSGTALSWKKWLGRECDITYERIGDVKGIHQLTVSSENESIRLIHEALSRDVFAEGAIWAARQITANNQLTPGLYMFESLVDKAFKEVIYE